MKSCVYCGVTSDTATIHVHHVVGRVGKDKDAPENLVELCSMCHYRWHSARTYPMAYFIYKHMKRLHGDKFPIKVNGVPKMTKWILEVEEANDRTR
jgi:5-methylcytosine-specific restriction endonuclease McrA